MAPQAKQIPHYLWAWQQTLGGLGWVGPSNTCEGQASGTNPLWWASVDSIRTFWGLTWRLG